MWASWGGGTGGYYYTPSSHSSMTSGNYSIVGIRCSNSTTGNSVSSIYDDLSTNYSLATSYTDHDPELYTYYGKLTASGTNVVHVTFTAADCNYGYIAVVEVSGLAASNPVDVSDAAATDGGSPTDITSNAFTTTHANEFVFGHSSACCAYDGMDPGTGFTLVAKPDNCCSLYTGGLQYQIFSSIQTNFVAHMTAQYGEPRTTMLTTTFSDGGGGGATPMSSTLPLMGI